MSQAIKVPAWILIVSALFALMELGAGVGLCVAPESMLETVDLSAKGVHYVVYMWAARQFALGVIFAWATFSRSLPMLTLAYLFLLVMFIGDLLIGAWQKNNVMIISAIVMLAISAAMLYAVNKRKPVSI
ncbi:MAG: hypothetical protein EOO15_08980 [Chitinophagaceae bacterium]|nr:MAG: hypothetical protein EOO15_08980 [Chitinophagaceae bacterium]